MSVYKINWASSDGYIIEFILIFETVLGPDLFKKNGNVHSCFWGSAFSRLLGPVIFVSFPWATLTYLPPKRDPFKITRALWSQILTVVFCTVLTTCKSQFVSFLLVSLESDSKLVSIKWTSPKQGFYACLSSQTPLIFLVSTKQSTALTLH